MNLKGNEEEFLDSDEEDQNALDGIASILAEKEAITIGVNQSFEKLCKRYKIPHELMTTYHKWLMSVKTSDGRNNRYNPEDIPPPGNRGRFCKMGVKVIAPFGESWRIMMAERGITRGGTNKMNCIESNNIIRMLWHNEEEKEKLVRAMTVKLKGVTQLPRFAEISHEQIQQIDTNNGFLPASRNPLVCGHSGFTRTPRAPP